MISVLEYEFSDSLYISYTILESTLGFISHLPSQGFSIGYLPHIKSG